VMPNLNVRRNALNEVIISREYCAIALLLTGAIVPAAFGLTSVIRHSSKSCQARSQACHFLSPTLYPRLLRTGGFAAGYR